MGNNSNCENTTDANSCKYKYALAVTSQDDPNLSDAKFRNSWKGVQKAVGGDLNVWATGHISKKKVVTKYKTVDAKDKDGKKTTKKVAEKYGYEYTLPYTLAGSEFDLNIPSTAVIKRLTYIVSMKTTDSKVTIKVPKADFRFKGLGKFDGSRTAEEIDNQKSTNVAYWYRNHYYVEKPNKNISSNFENIYYHMEENDIKKASITPEILNNIYTGVDLIFEHHGEWKADNGECNVCIKFIRVKVEYDLPKYEVDIYKGKSVNLPKSSAEIFKSNKTYKMTVRVKNSSSSKGNNQTVNVSIPAGTELLSYETNRGTFNTSTKEWSIPAKANLGKNDCKLALTIKPKKLGYSNLSATLVNGNTASYWYNVDYNSGTGYNDIDITAEGVLRKNRLSCIVFDITTSIASNTIAFNLNPSTTLGSGESAPIVSNGVWSLDVDNTDTDVSIYSQNASSVTLYKDTGSSISLVTDFHATLKYCFYPLYGDRDYTFSITNDTTSEVFNSTFRVEDAYEYIVEVRRVPDSYKLVNHRVVSELETNNEIIPCIADEGDAIMLMSDCRLTSGVWEDLDYIGCIPLEHLHFNPKSTFKDTLLNSTYKNKRYMGKKLATDEDITLNVRLHPQQVTTLQGLIQMDKPIPINANHKCFEGDALNHRGWAEVYAVKTEETNPSWYKCDIDVKYLTHNLNTRFKIDKGAKVSDYDSNIPSLMTEVYSSGDNLSETEYFVTDTDGTFYYSDDYWANDEVVHIEENVKNNFSIDNGQHIRITSKNPLTHISKVDYTWSSILIPEFRENAVSRIIRLIDKNTNRTVFEYQYDDIEIETDDDGNAEQVSAYIIYRILEENGDYTYYSPSRKITFRFNPSDVTLEDDSFDAESDDDGIIEESGEAHIGSTVTFTIKNNKLSVIDEGFNGRELLFDNLKLVDGEYLYEVEWINNNEDAETSDINCTFDFRVQDTLLTTTYADKFSKLIVSPFPIADKKVVFTRDAEEGTIYYYNDDKDEFSFLVEPYYQYLNGCDLVTSDGVSIFSLDYGYKIVYIQNGLVRLGFNRLNGELYLGKFDEQSDGYITTHNLHLEKFDDINVNTISDDKIEIQASDCIFTIYRGHPYIKVKHELEDIYLDTVFNRVWAESVGDGTGTELPVYWDLMNDKNLLDECVATKLKSDCIEGSSETVNDRQATSLSWSNFPTVSLGENTFTLTSTQLSNYVDTIDLNDSSCSFGEYTVEYESDGVPLAIDSYPLNNVVGSGSTTSFYAKVLDGANKGVPNRTVYFFEEYVPTTINLSVPSVIQSGDTVQFKATLKDVDGSEVKGQTIYFYAVED